MIDHIGINCSDLQASAAFYDRVLGVLGYVRMMDYGVAIGYGKDFPSFWISEPQPGGTAENPNREIHLAFQAADGAGVQAFVDTARSLGAEVLHEPRLWPEYHAAYFGGFVRDPDGNNIEACCHNVG